MFESVLARNARIPLLKPSNQYYAGEDSGFFYPDSGENVLANTAKKVALRSQYSGNKPQQSLATPYVKTLHFITSKL